MIITTGTSIEGKRIVEYKGLVFAKKSESDLFISQDKPKYQELYTSWAKSAEDALKKSAEDAGANAVIGVKQEIMSPKGMVVLVLIGTAVVVE